MICDADLAGVTLPQTPAIEALSNSGHPFHLTGSYFFGCTHPGSDIDFMTWYFPRVQEELTRAGFTTREDTVAENYSSGREGKEPFAGTLVLMQQENVQVQLVGDLRVKVAARDAIRLYHWEWHLRAKKEDRSKLWNAWMAIFQCEPKGLPIKLGLSYPLVVEEPPLFADIHPLELL